MQIPRTRDAHAERVALVLDNRNTHGIESLCETCAPKETREPTERLEVHDAPKHRSWLSTAKIELSAWRGQCLNRRIEDLETMRREIAAREEDRNNRQSKIDRRFIANDARNKRKSVYLHPNL